MRETTSRRAGRRTRRWAAIPLACLLLLAADAGAAAAQNDPGSSEEGLSGFVNAIGETLLFLAWPTAAYTGVSFDGWTAVGNGRDLRIRVHGTSAFSGGPLWAEVVVMIRDGAIRDISWGRHNAVIEPGTTVAAVGDALLAMSRQYQASQQASGPATATAVSRSAAGEFRITNRCHLPVQVAIGYRNLSGDWSSEGWWQFSPGEALYLTSSGRRLRSTADVWYYYAETTAGESWSWRGEVDATVRGHAVRMRRVDDREGDYELSLTCR